MQTNSKETADLHIGRMLKAHVKKYRIYQSGWAKVQGINYSTILGYYKSADMRIGTLLKISRILNYNFFWQIAALLPKEMPPPQENPLQKENEELKAEIKGLNEKIDMLKELMGRRLE